MNGPAAPPPPPEGARGTLVADFRASLVVFMVALPLCIAIARASGLPAETGVVSGIVGGVIVGLLSGSALSVSGPAAGLIVVTYDMVKTLGPDAFGLAVMIAGAGQLVAAALRLGVWFRAVSPAVVSGMLAGIGAVILGKQFHALFDAEAPDKILAAFAAIPQTVRAAVEHGAFSGPVSAGFVGLLSLAVMALWKPLAPRRLQILPAAVVAVLVATLVVQAGGVQAKTIDFGGLWGWARGNPLIAAPGFASFTTPALWAAVLVLSLIASAETLLCCTAVDSKHAGPRTRYNQELLAQGVGNMACGLVAALPITAVIVRGSVNVDAGARTRLSSVMHGVWLLVFALALPEVLRMVPVAALAGVLLFTGWKLLELPEVIRFWKQSRGEAFVYLVTAAAIVVTNLLEGVMIGVAVAAARLLWTFARLTARAERPSESRTDVYLEG
ncbi:MAG: SulP family inorganic anion transporter, partial [Gemmataceae bacterium]|nr:SulP family inorganic anion transporter [Gemmataceae bacterium]